MLCQDVLCALDTSSDPVFIYDAETMPYYEKFKHG